MQEIDMLNALSETVPVLGVTLLLCMMAGKMSKKLGVPKVSGYIVLGALLGPGVFNFLTHSFTESFSFFNELALGLILFNIGGEFNKKLISSMKKDKILYSILSVQLVVAFIFFLFFILLSTTTTLPLSHRLIISLFLGLIGVEAAPPTTLLVLKEYNAKGLLSLSIKVYLAFATITAVVGTLILTKFLEYYGFWHVPQTGSTLLFAEAIWNIVGSVIFGVTIGFLLSYFERFETKVGNILFAVIAAILFGQSLSYYLKVDSLLISLFLGFTVANASSVGEKLHESVKDIGGSIYALFFVLAGTHIEFGKLAGSVGLLGIFYIVSRILGIFMASFAASYALKIKEESIKYYHGLGVISHAGAALAIVNKVKLHSEDSAQLIFNIVVASIFVFEVLGPFLLKIALLKSDEISSWNPTKDKTSKLKLEFRDIIEHFKDNITPKQQEETFKSAISPLVNTDIVAIQADANLESIKTYLGDHSPLYPVVDKEHCFMGTLNLSSIKKVLEKTEDDPLVTAHSFIGESIFIPSNSSLEGARDIFSMTQKEVLPVVNPINRVLEGIIFSKDILVSLSKGEKHFDE
ncbi:transporter, CPA2 family [Bacteriovorax sp. DB6_IX]|nr:transporter, CPA2 family [Bacteriovorax sp. DB6_IX]